LSDLFTRRFLGFLDEDVDDDDAHSGCGDVDGASDSALAFQTHFPERAFEVFEVRLSDSLKAVGLDQFDNALEVGAHIEGKGVECKLGFLIEKADLPWHEGIIPFLQYRDSED